MPPENNLQLTLYRKLYLIRKSEQKIVETYFEDEMKTPMHMSMGEEAISVGVSSAIGDQGQVFGTYRSHALFLSRTEDTDDFFAEMYGRATSSIGGKGGSMHLCAPEKGVMGTSAIVASAIPVAVGAAFANKQRNSDAVVAVFFGDGAIDEGVFWESLNTACLMKLPVIFVCEDNGYAVHTEAEKRHGYPSIANIVRQYDILVEESDSTDVEAIHQLTSRTLDAMKSTGKPAFLHLKYYRYLEHVGILEDFKAGYRSEADAVTWKERDPITLQRAKLLRLNVTEEQVTAWEKQWEAGIDASIAKAKVAPFPTENDLYTEVI